MGAHQGIGPALPLSTGVATDAGADLVKSEPLSDPERMPAAAAAGRALRVPPGPPAHPSAASLASRQGAATGERPEWVALNGPSRRAAERRFALEAQRGIALVGAEERSDGVGNGGTPDIQESWNMFTCVVG